MQNYVYSLGGINYTTVGINASSLLSYKNGFFHVPNAKSNSKESLEYDKKP